MVLWLLPGRRPHSHVVDPESYRFFCDAVAEKAGAGSKWHIAIYLDINACLTCNEDMDSWRELQKKLPACDAVMSLWAPVKDSLDVAWAMKLEGMQSPVYVLDSNTIKNLNWTDRETPIKVLLDNQCRPVKIIHWVGNSRMARLAIEKLISEISS